MFDAIDNALREPGAATFESFRVPRTYLEHLRGGGQIAELEQRIAMFYGSKYAVCTSSATVALLAICLALDLKGTDFITSPLNFGAGLAGWLLRGNRPVFVDVDPGTLTIDPAMIASSVTSKTKAVLSVDLFGYAADDAAIRKAADDLGIWYIADSAQAFGATRNGRPASILADATIISFNSQKTIRAGEGGCIVTNNDDIYERLIWTSQHPLRQKLELGIDVYNEFAFSSRLHPAAAAAALATFDESLERLTNYQELCFEVISLLEETGQVLPAHLSNKDIRPTFFGLVLMPSAGHGRTKMAQFLLDFGYECGGSREVGPPVYQNGVFLQQYRDQFLVPSPCHTAEGTNSRISLSCLERLTTIGRKS